MRNKLLYACVVPLSLLAWHSRATTRAQHGPRTADASSVAQEQPGAEILQPSGWVAFQADVEITQRGKPLILGSFYRGSDGSVRLETWDAKDPSQRVISIKNKTTRTRYVKPPDKAGVGWKSYPLGETTQPYRYRTNSHIRAHSSRVEGYSLYLSIGPEGDTRLLAPDLNFFPLVVQGVKDGRREVYKNIKRIEPPASLFEPPSGVQVEAKMHDPYAPGGTRSPNR
jgi:hypothetical protein